MESVHRVYGKHYSFRFLSLLPPWDLFYCHRLGLLYSKHPNKFFFNVYNIYLTSFTTHYSEDQMQETNQYTAATNIQRIQRGIFGRSRANRVKQEYLRSMPIPIVSPGERLGNFGLQEMAAAAFD